MNRRDFTRLGLAMGLTPVAAQPTLAQMSARGAEKSASGVDVANRHRQEQELASNLQSNQRAAEIFGRAEGGSPSFGLGAAAPEGAASRNSLGHCAPQWPPLDTSCQPVWMINPGACGYSARPDPWSDPVRLGPGQFREVRSGPGAYSSWPAPACAAALPVSSSRSGTAVSARVAL